MVINTEDISCIFDIYKISTDLRQISVINFKDINVSIYYDPLRPVKYADSDFDCIWKARNSDSFYKGIIYRNNETGEITYPENAVIPEQTDRDRELIPKAIIIGTKNLEDKLLSEIYNYLDSEFKRRNNK